MDNLPICHICHQQFTLKGPAPYLLPCLHAVCETCVTSTAGGVISCSTCQREVNLTETHLQQDAVRQREIFHLTVQHRPSELLCTHEDDGNQAVCWCQECEEFLCEHCQNMHDSFKATRMHKIQDIKYTKKENRDDQLGIVSNDEYCSFHERNPIDFWDVDCNLLICSRCARGDHAGHEVEEIDVAAAKTRSVIDEQGKEVSQIDTRHSTVIERARQQHHHADEALISLSDKISHSFLSFRTLLDQREKELLVEIRKNIDEIKSHLNKATNISKPAQLKCRLSSEYTHKALLYSTKYGILRLKNTITDTTQVCQDSAPAAERELLLPVFQTESLDNLKSSISSFSCVTKEVSNVRESIIPHDKGTQTTIKVEKLLAESQAKHDKEIGGLNQKVQDLQTKLNMLETAKCNLETRATEVKLKNEEKSQKLKTLKDKVTHLEQRTKNLEASEGALKTEKSDTNLKLTQALENNSVLEGRILGKEHTLRRLCTSIENIGISPEAALYLLKTPATDKSVILQCVHLDFDKDRLNVERVDINITGELTNQPRFGQGYYSSAIDYGRLLLYSGTTGTVPLPRCGSPQYFEVKVNVGIDKPMSGNNLLLEVGLCRKTQWHMSHYIGNLPYSCSLTVAHCTEHQSICRIVSHHRSTFKCFPHTLPNIPRQSATLHYGVI